MNTIFNVFWYDSTRGMNPKSTDCEADALITTPSRRSDGSEYTCYLLYTMDIYIHTVVPKSVRQPMTFHCVCVLSFPNSLFYFFRMLLIFVYLLRFNLSNQRYTTNVRKYHLLYYFHIL